MRQLARLEPMPPIWLYLRRRGCSEALVGECKARGGPAGSAAALGNPGSAPASRRAAGCTHPTTSTAWLTVLWLQELAG